MRTSNVIARMSTGDPHAFAEARRKVANPDVCDLNKERLTTALVVFAPLEVKAPAATPQVDSTPEVDPIVAAAEAATKRLRTLAGEIMASSQDKKGARDWDELMGLLPNSVVEHLDALVIERGKVTYAQACAALGVTRRKDQVSA